MSGRCGHQELWGEAQRGGEAGIGVEGGAEPATLDPADHRLADAGSLRELTLCPVEFSSPLEDLVHQGVLDLQSAEFGNRGGPVVVRLRLDLVEEKFEVATSCSDSRERRQWPLR